MEEHPIIFALPPFTREEFAAVREIAPHARVISEAELAADPGLIGRIEVGYGKIPERLWSAAVRMRWLQCTFAGVDSLLRIPAVRAHPAVITNVHIHASSISEHLWGMCLSLTRNLHAALRAQDRREWNDQPLMRGLSNLSGRTLCIAGLGEIGRRCAAVGKALGMKVIGIRRRGADGPPVPEADEVVGPDGRREAFSRSRVIMLILPHTPETVRYVSRAELGVMRGAFLLNAGRGSAIDTDALMDALNAGNLRGAGLDVTDPEPLPRDHPLWSMHNVIITPHYSGNHPGYDAEAFAVFLENLTLYLMGKPLKNVVDKAEGY